MKKLLVSKERALEVLRRRHMEVHLGNPYDFRPKEWKSTTINDIKEIFSESDKWFQIDSINFSPSYAFADNSLAVTSGMKHAARLLESYIEWIEHYDPSTDLDPLEKFEKGYQKKYTDLLAQWNATIPDHNDLIEKNKELEQTNDQLTLQYNELIENSVQLNKITLRQIIKGIGNLPIGQAIALFSFVFGIFLLGMGTEKFRRSLVEEKSIPTQIESNSRANSTQSTKPFISDSIARFVRSEFSRSSDMSKKK